MKIFQLAAAAVIANSPLPTVVTAQTQDPITCLCTPTTFSFSLNFNGGCNDGSFDGDGIDGSICFFAEGGDSANIDAGMIAGISAVPPTRGRRLGNAAVEKNEEWVDTVLSKVDFTNHIQHAAAVHATRQLQLDTTPTKITSVIFLETDTTTTPELNIINQDSTYFDIDGNNGDILEYTSISSTLDVNMPIDGQLDKVPGGVILALFGENAAGEIIQNRVAWGYKRNYCEDEPLTVGFQIGWQSLDGYTSAYPEFCNAVTASPTEAPPMTTEATEVPPATTDGPMFSKSSKSKSGKATTKSSKAEKMSMPSHAIDKLVDLTSDTTATTPSEVKDEEDV